MKTTDLSSVEQFMDIQQEKEEEEEETEEDMTVEVEFEELYCSYYLYLTLNKTFFSVVHFLKLEILVYVYGDLYKEPHNAPPCVNVI